MRMGINKLQVQMDNQAIVIALKSTEEYRGENVNI